jgi:hypothetical protein
MANVFATKTGNWSDPTVWNTGALPTSADDVFSNNFTVTINQNVTVLSLRNTSASGITVGGGFLVTGDFSITAQSLFKRDAAGFALLTYNGSGTVNVNANITATSGNGGTHFSITGNGNVNFVGDIIGWNGDGPRFGIVKAGTGKLTFTGTVSVDYFVNNYIIGVSGGNFDFIGTVSIASSNAGVSSFVSNVISFSSGGVLTITGNLVNNATRVNGSQLTNCVSVSGGRFTHIGTMNNLNALGGFCVVSTNGGAINLFTGPFISSNYGFAPFLCIRMHLIPSVTSYFELRDSSTNGAVSPGVIAPATRLVQPGYAVDAPIPANVRAGVVYASGTQTGTLAMPTAASVAFGVPVDNTTGTAVMSPSDVWNVATSAMTTAGSIGERLKNASTVETTGDQLAALL